MALQLPIIPKLPDPVVVDDEGDDEGDEEGDDEGDVNLNAFLVNAGLISPGQPTEAPLVDELPRQLAVLPGLTTETAADILTQGDEETDTDFASRSEITLALENVGVPPEIAVTVGRLLYNKYKYGLTYPADIETKLAAFIQKLG